MSETRVLFSHSEEGSQSDMTDDLTFEENGYGALQTGSVMVVLTHRCELGTHELSREDVAELGRALLDWHERTGTCANGHYNADVYVKAGSCKYCNAAFNPGVRGQEAAS